jgi:hypothetical protein
MNKRFSIVIGLLVAGSLANWMCSSGKTPVKRGSPIERDQRKTRVILTPIGLEYYEEEHKLELHVEMGRDRRGSFYYVYVFSHSKWPREMPEWCRNRREAIMAEIERLTEDSYRLKWIEMR